LVASPVLAVVGAGFSGVMTALHLLRQPQAVKVILVERRSPIGLGAAYATDDPAHQLNVRAGNMSAWPDRPDDFVAWLRARDLTSARAGSRRVVTTAAICRACSRPWPRVRKPPADW
jgi:uncharacterized NAD(P)/FAD-binding protein YdhS